MGSSRLPGKILMDLCGRPVLWHVINRVKKCKKINKIVIAITVNAEDDVLEKFVENLKDSKVGIYRGSQNDVLSRYFEAAKKESADLVVRITSDCPLIDPEIVDKVIEEELKSGTYTSNIPVDGRTFPRGLDVEVFPFSLLEDAAKNAESDSEKEHVTPYIRQKTASFAGGVLNGKDLSMHRWTLDTAEDYELIKKIYEELWPKKADFLMDDVLKVFEEHPEYFEINSHIEQKPI